MKMTSAYALMLAAGLTACGEDEMQEQKVLSMHGENKVLVKVPNGTLVELFTGEDNVRTTVYRLPDSAIVVDQNLWVVSDSGTTTRPWSDFTREEKTEFAEAKRFAESPKP